MRLLQLTVVVRDVRTSSKTEQRFRRSPVTVGRRDDNGLRLDASTLSRHHGAFFFEKGVLQYVDLHSTNGSQIDGRQIQPGTLVDIDRSSVVTAGPFQVGVSVELVQALQFPSDPDATTAVDIFSSEPAAPSAAPWDEDIAASECLQRVLTRRGPIQLLRRSVRVIQVVAEAIIECWPEHLTPPSPIAAFTSPGELVAYLIDREDGTERLDQLKDLLVEMFGSAYGPVHGWRS